MKWLYLLIDLLTISVPFIFSFHSKIKFYENWQALFRSVFGAGLIFVIVDSVFTYLKVWGFNPKYNLGICLFNLPMEEILFFVCVPYSCVFTYYCLNKFYKLSWNQKTEDLFCILFSLTLFIIGIINLEKLYTSSTFIGTALLSVILKFKYRIDWFGNAVTTFVILLIPFFIVNGILTGTGLPEPVVHYNPSENLDIRVMTIPIEDFIYGFELFLFNLFLFLRKTR